MFFVQILTTKAEILKIKIYKNILNLFQEYY